MWRRKENLLRNFSSQSNNFDPNDYSQNFKQFKQQQSILFKMVKFALFKTEKLY